MERAQKPNLGLWSPPGGKVHTNEGESPHQCACREGAEELGILVRPQDLHLTGIVSESHYSGRDHWMMFLFEVTWKLRETPQPHREGRFQFFSKPQLNDLEMPATDRQKIWPLFWQHRGGFFAARCQIQPAGAQIWTLEESRNGTADH